MGIESNIFDEPVVVHGVENGYHDFNVLTTSAHSVLYRASKRGKYFIVKTTKDNSERQRQMLSREYELSKGCSHPHIVNTITLESDLAVGEGIVMEYIEGRTLQQFLDEKPSKSELNRVFGELLSAIDYIHKRGIVHNDLKPSNILITYTDNSLKLIDFGLADSDAEFVMHRLGCTSQYASPELVAREKSIDARSYGKSEHRTEREVRIVFLILFFRTRFLDHIRSDDREKDKCHPVVNIRHKIRKSRSETITGKRHQGLETSKPQSR